MARMANWALFSNGKTASSHQYQAGPLGLLCKENAKEYIYIKSMLKMYRTGKKITLIAKEECKD